MKGDFTRETFKSAGHYWGVLRQQGRVDLDADWNEQVRIAHYQHVTRTADLIGPSGGPAADTGFELSVNATGVVSIGRGSYYVAGILCENGGPVELASQPDDPGEDLPAAVGLYLAYLDVWDRHVTALEDPQIRETALNGPDTATRARTVWQVRTRPLATPAALTLALQALAAARAAGDATAEAAALQEIQELAHAAYCAAPLETTGGSLEAGTGTLAARASSPADGAGDPCRFEPGGGYRRQENRLYRVEIHDPGSDGVATFKWSRDNGSVVVGIEEFVVTNPGDLTTNRVRVRRLGSDSILALGRDDWVEIVADDTELAGSPGTLARITNDPDPSTRLLELSVPVNVGRLGAHPKVLRWDMPVDEGLMTVTAGAWLPLEDGIEVEFATGNFHTGDYWLIPARSNTADVEWPPNPSYPGEAVAGPPQQLPPMGIEHFRAPLAVLVHDGSQIAEVIDLRRSFPAVTDLTCLTYAGGDGQEPVLPDGVLPQPLEVGVANGNHPVSDVLVEFEVIEGGGELDAGAGPASLPVTAPTNSEGIASVAWRVDPSQPNHRVRARLLDRCHDPTHVPVFFNSHVNYQLHYLSGDGQEGMPGDTLMPLRVWVSSGRWPVEGVTVEFTVELGNGTIVPVNAGTTDSDGVAECSWTLDEDNRHQQVKARLRDGAGPAAIHEAAILFNANLSLAEFVDFDPAHCAFMDHTGSPFPDAPAGNVQDALDRLCPRITMTKVEGDGQTAQLTRGLEFPLKVSVFWGHYPLVGQRVQFAVDVGNATLSPPDPVTVDGNGMAQIEVTRVNQTDHGMLRISARCLGDMPAERPPAVFFHAHGQHVSGIQLQPFYWEGGSPARLHADELLSIDDFVHGLVFASHEEIDPRSVNQRTIGTVWLEKPYLLFKRQLGDEWFNYTGFGYEPIILAGQFSLLRSDDDFSRFVDAISWVPSTQTAMWLQDVWRDDVQPPSREPFADKLLVRVSLDANLIWGGNRRRLRFIDPLFAMPPDSHVWPLPLTPSPPGGGRPGDTLEMRFYIAQGRERTSTRFGLLPVRDSGFFEQFKRAFLRDLLGRVFTVGTNRAAQTWQSLPTELCFNSLPAMDRNRANAYVDQIARALVGTNAMEVVFLRELEPVMLSMQEDFQASTGERIKVEPIHAMDAPFEETLQLLDDGRQFDAVFASVADLYRLQTHERFGDRFLPLLVTF